MSFILNVALFGLILSTTISPSMGEAEFVFVIWRHGQRNPRQAIPNDPGNPADSWKEGMGELTELGIQQMYDLGKHFKEIYGSLTNFTYKPNMIRIASGDANRTINSAEAAMAGMYPPKSDQIWNSELLWQPIPVHSNPMFEKIQHDTLIKSCKKMKKLIGESDFMVNLRKDNQEVIDYLEKASGEYLGDLLVDIPKLTDALYMEKLQPNRTWPSWINESLFLQLSSIEEKASAYAFEQPETIVLSGGWILKQFFHYLRDFLNKRNECRFVGIAGHDDNLQTLATALEIPHSIAQYGFGSYYALEFHGNNTIQVKNDLSFL